MSLQEEITDKIRINYLHRMKTVHIHVKYNSKGEERVFLWRGDKHSIMEKDLRTAIDRAMQKWPL